MKLETDYKARMGFGVSRQDWPKAKHYIARVGYREARVILPYDGGLPLVLVLVVLACLLCVGTQGEPRI